MLLIHTEKLHFSINLNTAITTLQFFFAKKYKKIETNKLFSRFLPSNIVFTYFINKQFKKQ
jgi:hypothetical protein